MNLLNELSKIQLKSAQTHAKLQSNIEKLIEFYDVYEKKILQDNQIEKTITQMNEQMKVSKPLNTMTTLFNHFYNSLSHFGKQYFHTHNNKHLTKQQFPNNTSLSNEHSVIEKQKKMQSFLKKYILFSEFEELLCQHFMREGRWSQAKIFQKKKKRYFCVSKKMTIQQGEMNNQQKQKKEIDLQKLSQFLLENQIIINKYYKSLNQLKKIYKQVEKITTQINENKLQNAIKWCSLNNQIDLQFKLKQQQLQFHLNNNGPSYALSYLKNQFSKFNKQYEKDIGQIVGSIFFSDRLPKRYAQINKQNIKQLSLQFFETYLISNQIASENSFKLIYDLGDSKLQEYTRHLSMFNFESTSNTLPFCIDLPKSYCPHSFFLCPISKELCVGQGEVIMLSCGHLVSQTAVQRLQLGEKNRKTLCPICQTSIDLSNVLPACF